MSRRPANSLLGLLLGLLGCGVLASAARADVVLNEVNCEGTDWVELVNTADAPVDLTGWLLTDDPLEADPPRPSHRLVFPAASGIGGLESIVVERGSSGFPFGVSCGEDTLRLADHGGTLIDEVEVPSLIEATDTWGRYPNGTGPWQETLATPNEPNEPSDANPADDPAGWLFDPASVVEIDLSLPPESREALVVEPREYQDGSFSLTTAGGTYGPLEVGIRLKGTASFRGLDGKAAFKVEFDHSIAGQRFLGLEQLTLNNLVQDRSMIHETLAYEIFRAAGVAAPRSGYAFVRLDGIDYGVYLNLETPDERMLRRWFDSTRHLYEGTVGVDTVQGRAPAFEIEEGNDDRSDLAALIAAAGAQGDYLPRMAAAADLEQMTRMWAVERYVGHWDGYTKSSFFRPNNYFLHSDANGIFRMLPWGTDQTFEDRLPFVGAGGVLFERCIADTQCKAMYREAVNGLPVLVGGLGLDALAVDVAASLEPWQATDPRLEYTIEQIEEAVAGTRAFLAGRSADVTDPAFWDESEDPEPPVDPPVEPPVRPPLEPPDRVAPETRITGGPTGLRRARAEQVRIRFEFISSESASRFECRLDAPGWERCGSPLRVTVGRGRHNLRVRAIDAAGNADATPALRSWRVRSRRGG